MKTKIISLILIAAASVNSFSTVISYASYTNTFDVSFGELLTLQEENGYAPFTGENTLDNFYQAKSELPDEIPVIDTYKASGENVFFVSVTGDNSAVGSEGAPVATVNEALKRISQLSESERNRGSVIYIRESEYHITETININSEHTSDSAPLFIGAYEDENVIFNAGENVSLKKAIPVTRDNMSLVSYSRINNNAVGKLYYLTYDDMGLDKIPYESVFSMGDIPMFVSRYPNQGADTVESVIKDGSYLNSDGLIRTGLPVEWKSQDEKPFTWKDTGKIHIFGRVANEWAFTDGIVWFDDAAKSIKSTSAITPNHSPVTTNFWSSYSSTYYYTNIFEELDSFGEWYADDEERRFYFYLPESIDKESTSVSYRKYNGDVFNISGCQNVVIDGITVTKANTGIKISDCEKVVIQNSLISDTYSTAVKMHNTEKCGVLNSDIQDVKTSYAVSVSQSEEKTAELVPRRNFVQNSYFNNINKALQIAGSSGNIVSHNLIENTNYSAVELSGAENIFERNEFSGVANKITDAGGIYVGGDIKNRANTIRYNYFHDSKPDKKNARAIYNDDCSDMSWNYGNIVKNFSYGLFQHSGDDHVIMDNIVINANTYIRNSADYSTQTSLMKNYFFGSSPQFIYDYDFYNLSDSTTWQTRYKGILREKYDLVLEAKAGADRDGEAIYDKVISVITKKKKASDYENADDVQKACNLVADTGCYYIGNTYVVPGGKYSNGYGPSSYGINNICEPDNGGKPRVISTNANLAGNDFDLSEYIENIGLINREERENKKPVIYMEQKKEFAKDEFTGVSWSGNSKCSYYVVEIAADDEFEDVVINYTTTSLEYPLYTYSYDSETGCNVKSKTNDFDFLTDVPYYVRVTAVSLASCIENTDITSDTVEFILREELELSKEKAVKESYIGDISPKIKIAGALPGYLINDIDKQITLMLVENGTIKHIGQIDASENGTYSYVFSEEITDNTKIRIKAGTEDVTESLLKQSANRITEISFGADCEDVTVGNIINAVAKINNMFGVTDMFTIAVASYDEKNRLIGCSMIDSEKLEINKVYEMSNKYTVPENARKIKAFLWDKDNMKPLADVIEK